MSTASDTAALSDFNRRKHKRVDLERDILLNDEMSAFNLSEGGIGLETKKNLDSGSKLKLELQLGDKKIRLVGKIMRCSPSKSVFKECNIVGVMFVGITASDVLTIRRYLESLD